MQRRAALGAGLGEDKRAAGEVEGSEHLPAAQLCAGGPPVQATGNHQVQNEPDIVVHADGNAFAHAAQAGDDVAGSRLEGRVDRAQQEDRGEAHLCQRLAKDAGLQR